MFPRTPHQRKLHVKTWRAFYKSQAIASSDVLQSKVQTPPTLYDPIEHMQVKLVLAPRRSRAGAVTVLLLILLTAAVAVSLDDGNAVTRRGSSTGWQQGRRGHAARRLLLAVGKDTNEFHVEGVRRPANGNLAGEVGFDAGWKRIPNRDSNRKHN